MKRSDVEWLGQVPAHWEVTRLGRFGKFLKGNGGTKDDEASSGIPCVRYGDLYTTHEFVVLQARSFVSKEKVKDYTSIRFGDVLFAASGETIDEIGKSAANLIPSEACCGGDVIIFRPSREVDARYIGYATDCLPSRIQKATMGRGITVMHVYGHQLKRLSLALPPFPEQTAIVRFLDYCDRRIRHYIRTKEKLIALLEEYKQTIIHQAVTGQVDVRTGQPYPAYKDSSVEWLGQVPEHWEIRRVKSLSLVKRGASPRPIADPKYFDDDGQYAWVRIADVTASSRYLERTTQRLSVLGQSLSVPLEPGALFLSIAGSVGKPMITRIRCCIHDGFVYFPRFIGDVEFLCRVFAAGTPFARLGKLGTQLNLNTDTVGNISLGWPPSGEQTAIVRYLDKATANADSAIDRAYDQIELFREYRARLIADVVTGKLDVRGAAAGLPKVDPLAGDDVDDPEDPEVDSALEDLESRTEVII